MVYEAVFYEIFKNFKPLQEIVNEGIEWHGQVYIYDKNKISIILDYTDNFIVKDVIIRINWKDIESSNEIEYFFNNFNVKIEKEKLIEAYNNFVKTLEKHYSLN